MFFQKAVHSQTSTIMVIGASAAAAVTLVFALGSLLFSTAPPRERAPNQTMLLISQLREVRSRAYKVWHLPQSAPVLDCMPFGGCIGMYAYVVVLFAQQLVSEPLKQGQTSSVREGPV